MGTPEIPRVIQRFTTMGYELQMQSEILALLHLFRPLVPDPKSNARVSDLAADETKWPLARDLFDWVRARYLATTEPCDVTLENQYFFEEACLKSLFNETGTDAPFDPCSPYFVVPAALGLAQSLGLPVSEVVSIVV